MKRNSIKSLKHKLANNQSVYGLWVTLDSASITEIAVALHLDFVVIDAEHGHLDWSDISDHIRASVRSDTVLLVRIAEIQEGLIKRVLDIGADGIIVPHVETVEQLNQALYFSTYPPKGIRGIGAERATGWGKCFKEHVDEADDILVIPLIESLKGGENAAELAKVEGIDIFFVGPADYAASAGYPGEANVQEVNEKIAKATDTLVKSGKVCGIVATSFQEIQNRTTEGYKMFAIGFDSGLMINGIQQILTQVGRDPKISLSDFSKEQMTEGCKIGPPPPGYEPDRKEIIVKVENGENIELAEGVDCNVMVGQHTGAVNLFTGIVTFKPGETVLNSHTHPHSESITLLNGHAMVEVENRRYILNPLDNITIPQDCVHSVKNLSKNDPAVFHVAMPTTSPERTWMENKNSEFIDVPQDFNGHMGPERISRAETARRYSAGPNTEFIDYFNDILMPGIGMSGGYGLFFEKGRLPAHIHDFDESICILSGEATCYVEGRKYQMSDLDTAIQPRGRIHYFINNAQGPMSMIWVYAGPTPVRIEVPDEMATIGLMEKQTIKEK